MAFNVELVAPPSNSMGQVVLVRTFPLRTIRNTNDKKLTPEQYENVNRRQAQMENDARANENLALERKVNELMQKLRAVQQQAKTPPPLETHSEQSRQRRQPSLQREGGTKKVAFRHSRSASPPAVTAAAGTI